MGKGGRISVADLSPAYREKALRLHGLTLEAEAARKELRTEKRAAPEEEFHIGVVEHLSIALPADAWFCHVPNGGKRGKREAGRLKAMGTKAGAPDLLVIYRGSAYWLELKADGGRLSDNQKTCHAALCAAGTPVAVCRTLNEIETALRGWGIPLRGHVQGVAA